ncbi:tyrosine recombinase [Anaplasmataceae bacterium AB001_6]|nr:tyrosine recombinase [Anaplasmataceae bacterium AB001_6]
MAISNSRYLEMFLEMLIVEKNVVSNTVESYRSDMTHFFCCIAKDVLSVDFHDVTNYLLQRKKDGISNKTVIRNVSVLKGFFRFLQKEKLIDSDPTRKLSLPKKEATLPRVLTEDEINMLLENAEKDISVSGLRMVVMIEIMYSSGLRVSELLAIKISDVNNLRNGNFFYVKGKGSKERVVPLTEKALDALYAYIKVRNSDSIWLFPKDSRGVKSKKKVNTEDKHMTRQGFAIALKSLGIKSGIPSYLISPHVLRHSFATHMIDRDVNIKIVQEILGHSSIKTTQIYTHVSNANMEEIIKQKHPMVKSKKI